MELTTPRHRDLPPGRLTDRRNHLIRELRAGRRRRPRWAVVLAPVAALLLGASAWTAYELTRSEPALESVGCFDRAATSANVAIVSADGQSPVAICAELWAKGHVAPTRRVPEHLTPCVLDTGGIAVFPARDACSRLNLRELPATYGRDVRAFAAFRDDIVGRTTGRCTGAADAERIARSALARHPVAGWRVERGGAFTTARPCAVPAFDTQASTVVLVPTTRADAE
jgi:hypothetical protein